MKGVRSGRCHRKMRESYHLQPRRQCREKLCFVSGVYAFSAEKSHSLMLGEEGGDDGSV